MARPVGRPPKEKPETLNHILHKMKREYLVETAEATGEGGDAPT